MGHLAGTRKTAVLKAMRIVETQLKRFQRGTVLVTRLESVPVILWQRKEVRKEKRECGMESAAFYLCPSNLPKAKFRTNFFGRVFKTANINPVK